MADEQFSTSYVPLQPPYQIIKYGHDIGMQIGTLIATKQIQGDEKHPFRIETHSYPVVSYENKEIAPNDQNLFSHAFMEGVVWNRVELRSLSTICLSNSHLSWGQFISVLWSDHYRSPKTQDIQTRIFKILPKYGVKIDLPTPGEYTINLLKETNNELLKIVRSKEGDVFALNVVWNDDINVMVNGIIANLRYYLDIISPNRQAKGWTLTYTTTDDNLRSLVDKLNTNRYATVFWGAVVASFHLSAIIPYEEETMNDDKRSADPNNQQQEEHGDYFYGKDCVVFHDNIDPEKVALAILKLDRSINNGKRQLGPNQFTRVLYEVFNNIHWLIPNIVKTQFVAWVKFNCQNYFEDKDLLAGMLNDEMKKKVDEYTDYFVIKQHNGKYTDRREQFFRKNKNGDLLQYINDGK